ncbi:hypothetical protein ACFQMA_20750 [Halosimplex aquaticum]|uniref:Phospholipase_D-nuclease N-terminal n=1 Tax=Halosimplex aquaticum TaxID=3026162 RepID=A0ABD5YA58_9EURY|nr:hypothetical protein [Halosimplex aquaticum]
MTSAMAAPSLAAVARVTATATPPLQPVGSLVAALAIPALTWATLVVWVYQDARARATERPAGWAIAVAVVPPLLVGYIYYRGDRTRPQSDRERLTLTVLLALLSAMMVGTVFAPPDVFAQPRNTFGALLVTLPLFYLLVYREGESNDGGESAS